MREVLKEGFESIPAQVPRSEIEAMGVEIGLADPAEAARIFDRLEGISWRGDYVRSEEGWVVEVICYVLDFSNSARSSFRPSLVSW